jgi:TorA maturation chaperone TorD
MDDPQSHLSARATTYDLLARLYLGAPDAAVLEYVRELPGFAATFAPDVLAEAGQEALAAEHHRVFGLNVYPYESVFRDPELLLNTATTTQMARLYAACGFDPAGARVGAPDHLGLELRLMRDLALAEAAAARRGDGRAAQWARAQQARCLHAHLAWWAPLCAGAVARVAALPFYRVVADLTIALILADLADLAYGPPDTGVLLGAVARTPLEDEDSAGPDGNADRSFARDPAELDINAVVRHLITPVRAGFLLTRADMTALGRALDLPVGMGDRFQMLRGLFATAGQYEQVPALLVALDALWGAAETAIEQLGRDAPAWTPFARHWSARLAAGRRLLQALRTQAAAISDEV